MNKYSALIISCLLGVTARAVTEVPDTLVEAHDVHDVYITYDKSHFYVYLHGQREDTTYQHGFVYEFDKEPTLLEKKVSGMNFDILPFGNKGGNKQARNHMDVKAPNIGFVTAVKAPDCMEVTMGRSPEIMWDIFVLHHTLKNPKHAFEIGFGLDWRMFRMKGDTRFDKVDDRFVLGPYPEGARPDYSRVKLLSLFVPVRYCYSFSKHWDATFGVHFNLNTRASVKTIYRDAEGLRHKDFYRNIHPTRFTTDFVAQLGYEGIGIYVKYSPFNVFEKGYGPKFQTFAVGIALGL